MNIIYKIVFNKSLGTFLAVSELGKSHTKTKICNRLLKFGLLSSPLFISIHAFSASATSINYVDIASTDTSTTTATANNSIAIGQGASVANALSQKSIAIGLNSSVNLYTEAYNSASNSRKGRYSGVSSIAIGDEAATQGSMDVSIGYKALSSGWTTTAIGANSNAAGDGSVAIGNTAKTIAGEAWGVPNSGGAVAIGQNSLATGQDAIAIGNSAKTDTWRSIAIGNLAQTKGESTVAMGNQALADGWGATSIGTIAKSYGMNPTAVGNDAYAYGTYASAFGTNSHAQSDDTKGYAAALAVGTNTVALGNRVTAVGYNVFSTGNHAIAIGSNTGTHAMGQGNVVNPSAMNNAAGNFSMSLGTDTASTGNYSIALGYKTKTETGAENSVALGRESIASVADGVALGSKSVASIDKGILGANPLNATIDASSPIWTSTSAAVSVGNVANSITRQITSVAAGTADTDAVNVAQLNAVAEKIRNASDTIVAGNNIQITKTGNNVTVATKDDVKFNAVNVGNKVNISQEGINAGNTKVTGVADGDISPTSKDAVNGSQLYAFKQQIINGALNDTSASISEGSDALTITKGATTTVDNTKVTDYVIDLSQTIKDDIQKGVDAKEIVDNKGLTFSGDSGATDAQRLGSTVEVKGDENITTKASGKKVSVSLNKNVKVDSVKTGDTTINNDGITINNGSTGNKVSLTKNGLNNGGNRITQVADGKNDTDAVNLRQLKQVDSKVNRVDHKLRAGIAQAGAMANIPQVTRNGGSGVGFGVANYRGESAVSVGYSKLSDNGHHIIRGSVSVDSRGFGMAGAGYMYQW